MATRYDRPKVPLEKIAHYEVSYRKFTAPEGKTHFVKLGVAFPQDNGRIKIHLDALPLNTWDGELWLFPKGPKGEDPE